MRKYEASLWPNNQPPILLGYFLSANAKNVREMVALDNGIPIDCDDLCVVVDDGNTPIKNWNKHD